MNDLQINISLRPETPQKPVKKMCATEVYIMSPFLHIFLQGFVRKLFVCKMCAKKMYNLSHIFSSGEEGLTGDFPPAQTPVTGVAVVTRTPPIKPASLYLPAPNNNILCTS